MVKLRKSKIRFMSYAVSLNFQTFGCWVRTGAEIFTGYLSLYLVY